MTIKVIGTPQLSLLELISFCEELGVPLEFLVKTSSVSSVRTYWPTTLAYYSSVHLVYVDSLEGLRNLHATFSAAKWEALFLVQVSTTELQDKGINISSEGLQPLSRADLRIMLRQFYKTPQTNLNFLSKDESSAALLRDKSRESLLSKLQTSFYRIKDKEERSRVQALSYRFLVLKVKNPMTGSDYIDGILLSPVAVRFRKALIEVKSIADMDVVAESYAIDRFEVAYVLQKNGRLPKT